jgi:hypothetical protein
MWLPASSAWEKMCGFRLQPEESAKIFRLKAEATRSEAIRSQAAEKAIREQRIAASCSRERTNQYSSSPQHDAAVATAG